MPAGLFLQLGRLQRLDLSWNPFGHLDQNTTAAIASLISLQTLSLQVITVGKLSSPSIMQNRYVA